MTHIFILDDHLVFIEGIISILHGNEDGIKVDGWATSVNEANVKLGKSKAQVILLDLLMPEISGIEYCKTIRDRYPDKKIIILTGELDPVSLEEAWSNGAHAILIKSCGKKVIIDTIHQVLSGQRVIGKHVAEIVNLNIMSHESKPLLTQSEIIALNLLAQGFKRSVVASKMGNSINAVNFHCKNIFRKLETDNIVTALEKARQKKLI